MGGESRDVDVRTGSEGGEQGGREGDDGDEEMNLRAVVGATVCGGDVLERRGEGEGTERGRGEDGASGRPNRRSGPGEAGVGRREAVRCGEMAVRGRGEGAVEKNLSGQGSGGGVEGSG